MAEVPITSRDTPKPKQFVDRLLVADAAAELALDSGIAARISLDAGQIDRQALAGAFQIDDVQVLGALASANRRATAAGSSAKTVSC